MEMNSQWFNKEEFRPIPNDDRFVSIDGRILSLRKSKPKILVNVLDTDGYFKVSRPEIRVAQAVLLAWRGPRPDGHESRHLDGDKQNNHVSNLKWGTPKQNGLDKRRHGTAKWEKNNQVKMSEEMVIKLREEYKSKPLSVLEKENSSMSRFAIWAAVSGYTWAHLPGAIPKNRKCSKGTNAQ
jgi:hypothetical protein